MNAAANIFIGMTEAPLMIKPLLPEMTNSELHCVMTSGMATIAGGVLAAYIEFGVSATHLLTASVMSAPAALATSKLLYPGMRPFNMAVKYNRGQSIYRVIQMGCPALAVWVSFLKKPALPGEAPQINKKSKKNLKNRNH
jgi:nucleoside permease NupC